VCDLETIGAPSKFRLIRRAAALCPTLDLSCEENAHGLGPTEIKKKFFSFRDDQVLWRGSFCDGERLRGSQSR
jgi:hypothetical protein